MAFGTLTGALAEPLFMALRFKETAPWNPYVHMQNVEDQLLSGKASRFLTDALELHMSVRASTGILVLELVVLLAVAYAVFRRQQIVY